MTSEQVSLLKQPREILEMIFGHMDMKSGKDAALLCPSFYEYVCYSQRKKPQCLVIYDTIVLENAITGSRFFDSIIKSSRRLNLINIEIKSSKSFFDDSIFYNPFADEILNCRLIDIFKKFKQHLKKLKLNIHSYSWDRYVELLGAASDVEELSLRFSTQKSSNQSSPQPLKMFSKLRRLQIYSHPRAKLMLDAVPDDSLEEFFIGPNNQFLIHDVQAFVDRQKKIRKWHPNPHLDINIDHLDLEELTYEFGEVAYPKAIGSVLEKQPKLKKLRMSHICDATFNRICRLEKLESLCVVLDNVTEKSLVEGLNNLKLLAHLELDDNSKSESEFWPGSSFLANVKLPRLRNLILQIKDRLEPQFFCELGRGMQNIQELDICYGQCHLLPSIIESLQNLKTLTFTADQKIEAGIELSTPNRQNESLETLRISMPICPGKQCYKIIDACPNLKSLDLSRFGCFDSGLLDCVQRQTQLTSFTYVDHQTRDGAMNDHLDPTLVGFIEHFQNSPCFVKLHFDKILDFKMHLVRELIGKDVEKSVGIGYLRLIKKSKV